MENTITHPAEEGQHTHTVIFLHGRDSNAKEFKSEFFESEDSEGRTFTERFPNVKWVFPLSKIRKSERFGVDMVQWFDIWSVEIPNEKDEIQIEGLKESIEQIQKVISDEAKLVDPRRIVLGGISQGCATAIHAILSADMRLGGFIGLCSWLPFQEKVAEAAKEDSKIHRFRQIQSLFNARTDDIASIADLSHGRRGDGFDTPVFISHSENDPVVPSLNGWMLGNTLRKLGMEVTWKEYEIGGHWVNEPKGVDDICEFLDGIIDDELLTMG